MIYVYSADIKGYWEQKGRVYGMMCCGFLTKHEAELCCASECPDPELKERLQAENKKNRKARCDSGEHVRSFVEDKCVFCDATFPPLPEHRWNL